MTTAPALPAARPVSTGDQLLRAILEQPADDAPRLLYADWLDIDGPPECRDPDRAEFVRVQIELAKWEMVPGESFVVAGKYEFCPGGVNLAALRRRERELLKDHHPKGQIPNLSNYSRWAGDWRWLAENGAKWEYRRGFVAHVALPLAAFLSPCGECKGNGHINGQLLLPACPQCRGTGRLPGLAGRLAGLVPLERVTLTDREPLQMDHLGEDHGLSNPYYLFQHFTPQPEPPHRLPLELVEVMYAETPAVRRQRYEHGSGQTVNCYFQTTALALAALSRAAVSLTRRLCGLPAVGAAGGGAGA